MTFDGVHDDFVELDTRFCFSDAQLVAFFLIG